MKVCINAFKCSFLVVTELLERIQQLNDVTKQKPNKMEEGIPRKRASGRPTYCNIDLMKSN